MSMRMFLALSTVLMISPIAAAQSASNAGKKIVCQEMGMNEETGDDVPMTKLTITLGADGKASQVVLVRPKTSEMAAINKTFVLGQNVINHSIEKNDSEVDEVTGEQILDPETKKPQYKWGIEDVEMISAKSKGLSTTVVINDHLYAGRAGSVIAITQGDQIYISSGMGTVDCSGALSLPAKSVGE